MWSSFSKIISLEKLFARDLFIAHNLWAINNDSSLSQLVIERERARNHIKTLCFFTVGSVLNFCFPVSLFVDFCIFDFARETGKQLLLQIGKQGKLFPCFPIVIFSPQKCPKNGSRTSILSKFVVFLSMFQKNRVSSKTK